MRIVGIVRGLVLFTSWKLHLVATIVRLAWYRLVSPMLLLHHCLLLRVMLRCRLLLLLRNHQIPEPVVLKSRVG